MTNNMVRKITCLVTLLALVAAPSLNVRGALNADDATASAAVAATPSASTAVATIGPSGRGWGVVFGCVGCLIAGGLVVAGGPGSILIAVNTPGSSIALLACAGSCYEALAM
jgi:hypothetical protein